MAFGDGEYVTGGLSMQEAMDQKKIKPMSSYLSKIGDYLSKKKDDISESFGDAYRGQPDPAIEKLKHKSMIEKNMLDSIGIGEKDSGIKGKYQVSLEDLKNKSNRKSSSLRDAMISMGIPVKNMTKEEKKRKASQAISAKDRAALEAAAEAKRLQRISQVATKLSPAQSFVGGGQFGSFGTGIAPGRRK